MQHVNKMILVPEGMFNSLKEKHKTKDIKSTVSSTIQNLDKEMGELLSRTDIPQDTKAKMYTQTLKRYLVFREKQKKSREAPVPVTFMTGTEKNDVLVKEENDLMNNDSRKNITEDPILQYILENVSSSKKANTERILQYLISDDSVIDWNTRGEVNVEGKRIPGSHLSDLVTDLIQTRKGFDPIGWKFFAQALTKMNVPKGLVSNTQRRNFMQTEYNFHPELEASNNGMETPEKTPKKRKISSLSKKWSPYPTRIKALSSK